ncbi:MAG: diaminopimelate epimerase [Planctomycetota bacterium]
MRFTKMHGCGNDYILVDGFEEEVADPARTARTVSDRHLGIGGDGLVLILPARAADLRMRMFNPDGSEAEMCGNAIRCVAKYAYEHHLARRTELEIDTLAGVKHLDLTVEDGRVVRVRVNMGEPLLDRSQIPMEGPRGRVLAEPLDVDGRMFQITCVSMGNPHTIVRIDQDPETYPVAEHGPAIETHPRFPARTNVEFVHVVSSGEIRSRTWERGAGETLACGTGASATAVACAMNGWTDRSVLVHLRGGDLQVEWAADNSVYLTGPAVEVFRGEIDPD